MSTLPPPQRLADLNAQQLKKLAPLAKTTYGTLRQVAAGHRSLSSMAAIAVEKAGRRIGLNLPRELHANGCATCEFARACRKELK